MAIEKEKFFEIIKNVSESKDLNENNLLEKIKNELKEKDIVEYNKFDKDFSKEYQFSIKISEEVAEDWTLLHLAVACNNLLIVELLLRKKVNVNTRVKDGSKDDGPTALHIAASYGHKNVIELLLSDNRINPLLKSRNKTPRGMVEMIDDIQNREIIVKRLETAEKNYSPKKTKDLIIKTEGGGRYCLSQNNHKTQAGLAVNVGNVTSAPANVIDPHLERCDSIHSDGSVSGYSSLESEQSETTYIRGSENKLKESQEQEIKNLKSENAKLNSELKEIKNQHSKYVAENETKLEAFNKRDEENKLLKQEINNLKSENAKLNSELKEIKNQHSKYVAENETKLEAFNKRDEENKLLKQEINNLKSENAKLNSELEKNKNQHSQTSEVSLKKVEKKPPLSKVAYVSLVTTSMVGSILSIVSGLFVLSMITTSVTSALVAGGITYTMSTPATELKGVAIEGLVQHSVGKV